MPWLTWLADVLRDNDLTVRETPGWKTLGHGAMGEVLGVLCHHTAGPASGNYPSERVVINGRTGLAGPLANLGLARDGTWITIAAGQAWHAGTGSVAWCPANQGNSHLIGIEAESTGRGDWTDEQLESYPRGVAALLFHLGLGSSRAIAHREWAPQRKIDPAGIDMNHFRAQVARHLKPAIFTAAEETKLTPEQDQMLRAIHREVATWLPNRRGPGGKSIAGGGSDTVFGYAINADGFGFRIEQQLADIQRRLDAIEARLQQE